MKDKMRRNTALSPRDLASAIGVSESSVKRWIDSGLIRAQRTSGGHRRVELLQALRDLRDSGIELAPAGLLGLGPADEPALGDAVQLGERLHDLLSRGRGAEVEAVLLGALASRAIEPAELFDGPVRDALARIGELWTGGFEGVFVEHRATQILLRVLDRIDALFTPPSDGLIAVGGSVSGDPSSLPTRIASVVLAAEGVYPVNLGADTPGRAFLDAADHLGAGLVWISVGFVADVDRQSAEIADLAARLDERGLGCILGGREADRLRLPKGCPVRVGRSMRELAAFAGETLTRPGGERLALQSLGAC